jgi:dolichol-phosphate mannosyltransferase
MGARPTLSLVLPIFNEEEVIPELHVRLQEFLGQLGLDSEVVFVDDGSKDRSLTLLRGIAATEPRYRVLSFARNFGHQTAITAGVDYARGRAVVVMDADLQDPPEVVLEMVQQWRAGYDVVYGKRRNRAGETWFKLFTAKWFYRVFRFLIPIEVPLDTGDFRLMSRRVVIALRELRETHRFVRGLVSWVGFKQTAVLYDRPGRFAGETKYPLRKMLRFAIDGITSFSILPLRFATYLGMLISSLAVLYALYAIVAHFAFHATVEGWTTVVVLVALLSAVQLLMIGILGEYVGRIYEQVKSRPLYVVGETINADARDDDSIDEEDARAGGSVRPPPVKPAPPTSTLHGVPALPRPGALPAVPRAKPDDGSVEPEPERPEEQPVIAEHSRDGST